MSRLFALLFSAVFLLTACTPESPTSDVDGKPRQRVYRISKLNAAKVQYRMLDSVNALRSASGAPAVRLNARLNAAAATHSRDMSIQNRPWHFGSDGSSPLVRVQRAGFSGQLKGENISETYETELETLSAWMERPDTRNVILDPTATEMGLSWFQENNGKIWWTMVTGG